MVHFQCQSRNNQISIYIYIYIFNIYIYVAPWVRVHKGRGIRFQTRLWVLGSTPKDKKIPQNGLQQTPWAYCCYTSRFGLSAAAATLFRTCAALSHDPCSENGRWLTWQYRMHARLSDRLKVHPRLTPVELQIHTGLFFLLDVHWVDHPFQVLLQARIPIWLLFYGGYYFATSCFHQRSWTCPNGALFGGKCDSMGFVKQSASIIAVEIQRHWECPAACCLINITSTVVSPLFTVRNR